MTDATHNDPKPDRTLSEMLAAADVDASLGVDPGPRAYGLMDASRMTNEAAASIATACEAMIAENYRAVETLEMMAREARETVDAMAAKMRTFSKGFSTNVSAFFTFAQKTCDASAKASAEFEQEIERLLGQGARPNDH